jgi:hypothetical protein
MSTAARQAGARCERRLIIQYVDAGVFEQRQLLAKELIEYDPERVDRAEAIIQPGIIGIRQIDSVEVGKRVDRHQVGGEVPEPVISCDEDDGITFIMCLDISDEFFYELIGQADLFDIGGEGIIRYCFLLGHDLSVIIKYIRNMCDHEMAVYEVGLTVRS